MTQYDLLIIGAGSGNSLVTPEMDEWNIAIVERDKFGGTCLNVGCIPSKMFIYAAEVAEQTRHLSRYGLRFDPPTKAVADWPAIVHRVFGRIDPIAMGGEDYRRGLPNVDVFMGDARFTGLRELQVNGSTISAERIVLAAGARPNIPKIAGLSGPGAVPFHTSDTIMRIEALPAHLIILGSGFIAAELGHVFEALGTKVTIVTRTHVVLRAEDDDISARFTEMVRERFELVLDAQPVAVRLRHSGDGVAIDLRDGRCVEGDMLLIATGRVPNGGQLEVEKTGVELDARGFVMVDDTNLTGVQGIWALGDMVGRHQLKHMANLEALLVQHNVLHPDAPKRLDDRAAPHAVFTTPQIGSVGLTERQAMMAGVPHVVIRHDYASAAYGWAMEDTTSFVKLLGDPVTHRLLGAHIIGPQASVLVQLLVQGMHLGATVEELAEGQIWIHPALSEVVEQALLKLAEALAP